MTITTSSENKLSSESSPYLQQHVKNPVQWFPWSSDAFNQAKKQDKPIFLSIGYATCHWCHVMAHESFEDKEVAKLLNDTFICIKVDREERPDLDNIYMKVCYLLTRSGGWPLTIIMTPDKKPFFAATYLPKTTRFGRIGIIDLTAQIKNLWQTQREKIYTSAEEITKTLTSPVISQNTIQLNRQILDHAYEQLVAMFDEHYGGFSTAPKFPTPHHLFFLLRYWNRTKTPYALTMVERTLEHMRLGGIFDQVGYGFHRYATDRQWNIPHFEKMLYDQALLILAYTEAYQVTHNQFHKQSAKEIITYVIREMTSPEGGFYTAQDADSEDEEGRFYTWTSEELQSVLSQSEFRIFSTIFAITKDSNSAGETSQQRSHRNILFHQQTFTESAQLLQLSETELNTKIMEITTKLYHIRKKRVLPLKDDKILSDWNGLMIAALAKAEMVFGENSYMNTAEKAVDFLKKNMMKKNGQMLHRYRNNVAGIQGFADDYAFTIWGFLELYQATFNQGYLYDAIALNRYYIDHFWDDAQKGFFFSETTDSGLPRIKEWYDGALPCANSVSAMNLLRLSRMTADAKLEQMADDLLQSISTKVDSVPTGYTYLLCGVDFAVGPSREILIVGAQESVDTQELLAEIRHMFLPSTVVLLLSPHADRSSYPSLSPSDDSYCQIDKKTTVYVCTNYQCHQPVTTIKELKKLLI